jgi:hypothetical protein
MSGIQIIGYYTVKNNVIFLIDLNVQKHFFHKIKCEQKKSDILNLCLVQFLKRREEGGDI